ncbi:uncharacterized protein J3D65DRAFT_132271 [Phyllosticta citribraziliensis]|uniref:vWA found in TerF C terminus domain-containing protein n=1 Tax=Phyllosticta citribraziliensis TaxID=989973 RepID=A0ABR1L8C7_9PEZI
MTLSGGRRCGWGLAQVWRCRGVPHTRTHVAECRLAAGEHGRHVMATGDSDPTASSAQLPAPRSSLPSYNHPPFSTADSFLPSPLLSASSHDPHSIHSSNLQPPASSRPTMGLASKLAAAGPPAAGGGGGGGGAGGAGAYPGAPAYQAYPGASGGPPPQGYPPQGPPPGQGYGAPPPGGPPPGQQASPAQLQAFKQMLGSAIQENQLHNFYPPNSPALDQIAQRASVQVAQLCQRWRLPQEIGNDIVKLGLFDIILYIDDSGSMQFEENGERIKDLKLILERVAFAATLFDDDGISVRFMNSMPPPQVTEHIRTEQQVDQLMSQIQFKGLTPMGSHLKERVIDEVLRNARAGQLRKPVLVITITDGQPAGEPQNAVFETIKNATSEIGRMPQYGPGAIKFQFAQVGNDEKAREFLSKLDQDPMVGHLVDCTSNYENESAEMARANPPVDLTPELWLVKLLLGAIDKSYDRQDEKGNAAPPPGGPGGYGAPPGQYGAPQGGYGAPPPGQYGQPPQGYNPQGPQGGYGAPPPGQYGAPQGGQYGRPPPGQPGYPPQQGGYPPRY